jgi:hypothetical protein
MKVLQPSSMNSMLSLLVAALAYLGALAAVPTQIDTRSTTGEYELLGEAPIAAAHSMQLPCGDR